LGVYASALKFLYEVTLGRPGVVSSLTLPKRRAKLPQVLSGNEVEALLATIHSNKEGCYAKCLSPSQSSGRGRAGLRHKKTPRPRS
jgi:hypothetical protein